MISMDDKYMVLGFAAHLTVNHSHHFVDSVAMEIEFINQTNIK